MERLSRHRSGAVTGSGVSRAVAVCLVLCIALLIPQTPKAQTNPDAPVCSIRMDNEGRVMQLVGIFVGPEPAAGSYRLTVLKQGLTGTSLTVQNGRFAARRDGGEQLLGAVAIRVSAGDALSALLTIHTGEVVICTATL